MKWTALALLALTLATAPVAAQSTADVTCHIYPPFPDGKVQIDCVGDVLQEPYERLVRPYDVYEALGPMFAEWRVDVQWEG